MYRTVLDNLIYKIMSLDSFYMYMKMYNFPFQLKDSKIMCFFLLPIIGDGYKIMLDFPDSEEAINKIHKIFKEEGCSSPVFDYYRMKNPNYDIVKLFVECYNVTRITPFDCYIPVSVEQEHKRMGVELVKIGYVSEKALKNPILCTECMEYLRKNKMAEFNATTKIYYFDFKLLPKNTQVLIEQSKIDTSKYLFSREIYQETMLPDMIER